MGKHSNPGRINTGFFTIEPVLLTVVAALLAEHPFLAQVVSHDYSLAEAEAAFATALDSAASSEVLSMVGDFER